MTLGRNTAVGAELRSFVERVEYGLAAKKEVADDISAILAEAKARGFVPAAIRHVVKVRAMKPHDRQEAEAIIATYLHALGDEAETPLFRSINAMAVDITSQAAVTEALKKLVPTNGSIVVEVGGKAVKLTRDKDGHVTARDHVDRGGPDWSPAAAPRAPARDLAKRPDAPDVDVEGAEALGREAYRANEPVIANPFAFGDPRRGAWDGGWRKESGGDGMGPDSDD